MAYRIGQAEGLIGGGGWYPGKNIREALGKVVGNYALKNRRPVGYETEKGHANVRPPEEETNWSDRVRGPLYRGLFNLDEGSDIYNIDEQGGYSLNPDNKEAKEIQWNLNESFKKAKESGELFTHPDLPDAGKSFYKSADPTLGDAYFDKEGNVVDYWNVGLDKGEKIWGGLGSIMPGGRPWMNKSNLYRAVAAPFTSPKTFTGKATDSSEIGVYSPKEAVAQDTEGWYPGKNIKKLGGLLGGIKDKFTTDRSPIELEMPEVRDIPEEILSERNMPGRLDQPDMSAFRGPIQTATDPRHLARTIDVQNPESVKEFQKATGLTADGILGPKTLAKLREIQGIQ